MTKRNQIDLNRYDPILHHLSLTIKSQVKHRLYSFLYKKLSGPIYRLELSSDLTLYLRGKF